ncbi:MAG: hypothetical protein M3R02_17055 [Chloroflexota bacterium]|nr:hypothetical protein [Chloroflexota bacterium]
MARFAVNLPSGTTDYAGDLRLVGRLLSGSGVLGSGDMAVAAQGTPDMTVAIAAGDVAIFNGSILYHGWATTPENLTIPSNASGVTKITAVVAAIDASAASQAPGVVNNPNGVVYQTFTLGGSDTSTPTDAQISTGIGGKPFIRLANVTVGNGVTSINSGNIANVRVIANARIGDASVTTSSIASKAVTNARGMAWGIGSTEPSTNSTTFVAITGVGGNTFAQEQSGAPLLLTMSVPEARTTGFNGRIGLRFTGTNPVRAAVDHEVVGSFSHTAKTSHSGTRVLAVGLDVGVYDVQPIFLNTGGGVDTTIIGDFSDIVATVVELKR